MTKNQEKELFTTLAKLVTGVNVIQSDVKDIKVTQAEHSTILGEHSRILGEHSRVLGEHSGILASHSQKHEDHTGRFDRLESKVDSVAEKVMEHDRRISAIETGRIH
ncbi:MAG TPA: hypothetical protein VMZ26_11950 [Pyrinomonadaceae bacterium]|nr:hypothetical protein [Pyrinomonadaceae bacterium]